MSALTASTIARVRSELLECSRSAYGMAQHLELGAQEVIDALEYMEARGMAKRVGAFWRLTSRDDAPRRAPPADASTSTEVEAIHRLVEVDGESRTDPPVPRNGSPTGPVAQLEEHHGCLGSPEKRGGSSPPRSTTPPASPPPRLGSLADEAERLPPFPDAPAPGAAPPSDGGPRAPGDVLRAWLAEARAERERLEVWEHALTAALAAWESR